MEDHETESDPSDSGAITTEVERDPSDCGAVTMEMIAERNACPEPEQSADPRSADWPLPTLTSTVNTETKPPPPPPPLPLVGSTPSDPATDIWMMSQLQAPPPAPCQNQLIIVEPRGQTLPCECLVVVTGQSEGRELFVIPSNQLSGSQLPVISSSSPAGPVVDVPVTMVTDDTASGSRTPSEQTAATSLDVAARMKALSSSTPSWALRLHSVEKLGDSYRGFCCSGAEVEAILLLHKQQTGCVFGTRQSPSLDKPATRLMWKSQYVPYDGIPFVNTGSRAVVMECQFGPRRKGLQLKKKNPNPKNSELTDEVKYKATCPARIYIKKVRKFPEFRVTTEPTADRKSVRQEQEKAFQCLKNQNLDTGGVIRFYLQLPTEKAHLYHTMEIPPPPDLPPPTNQPEEEKEETMEENGQQNGLMPSRLHPRVAERIRELVAAGHHQVYTVRKQLRRFVEKELFKSEGLPERHNLRFFPTVNDIKNHIHESQTALGLKANTAEWTEDSTDPLMETVTLTLTPAAEDSDCLSPEAVQLFSSLTSLQPRIFAQLQGLLQPLPPPISPTLPLVIHPSSFFQTPAGESAGALGLEEKLDVEQQAGGGTQEVVLQNGER